MTLDTTVRRALRQELERRRAASPWNAQANFHLANLDFLAGDRATARRHLNEALDVEPSLAGAHRRLGYLSMDEGHWRDAIRDFERELALRGAPMDEYERIAQAWEKLGDVRRAARWYRRELDVHAANDAARAALRRLEAR